MSCIQGAPDYNLVLYTEVCLYLEAGNKLREITFQASSKRCAISLILTAIRDAIALEMLVNYLQSEYLTICMIRIHATYYCA